MEYLTPYIIQALNGVSFISILVVVGLGLGIIFGMMRVINLAHGEFFMIGAYTVYALTRSGLSFWLGLMAASFVVAAIGVLLERTIIRWLYYRTIDTILATWGVSLFFREGIKIFFGNEFQKVDAPFSGALLLGPVTYPMYRSFVIVFAFSLFLVVVVLFTRTRFGIRARAVIENPEIASALGINTSIMNVLSFAIGSALAGLAGAIMAPLISVSPNMGLGYVVQSFMAVILGGMRSVASVLLGGSVIGGFNSIFTFIFEPVVGETIVLLLVIAIIGFRPRGLVG